MPKIKYKGRADVRKFLKGDFTKHDISDQDAVTFDASNNFTAEVSDAAAEFLTTNKKSKRDFELADGDGEAQTASTSSSGDDDSSDTEAPVSGDEPLSSQPGKKPRTTKSATKS